ncbi:MAG TPA: hypothetical protein VGQ51_06615, partial [Puia sp.]|nr:hypothetical protein [Puia sp.]
MKKTIFKKIVLGILGAAMVKAVRAQTFAEWFQQNSTRLKYYAGQVAALQAYLGQMQQGFQITSSGLGDIGSLKNDEFALHSNQYSSLTTVNPAVSSMGEVMEIVALARASSTRLISAMNRYRRDGMLTTDQLNLVRELFKTAIGAELQDVEMLKTLLTNNVLQLTDDQRVSRVLAIHTSVRQRYGFVLSMTDRIDLFERQLSEALAQMATVE